MQRRRVLVVDDDELTLDILRTILDLEEFEVVTASDGDEAVEVINDGFDVVVLDVMMPGLDGYSVCRHIKADDGLKDVPVVLLTAKDRREDIEEGEKAGADAYLTKPFSPLSLIETLNRIGVGGNGS